jgi:hypothetical protein
LSLAYHVECTAIWTRRQFTVRHDLDTVRAGQVRLCPRLSAWIRYADAGNHRQRLSSIPTGLRGPASKLSARKAIAGIAVGAVLLALAAASSSGYVARTAVSESTQAPDGARRHGFATISKLTNDAITAQRLPGGVVVIGLSSCSQSMWPTPDERSRDCPGSRANRAHADRLSCAKTPSRADPLLAPNYPAIKGQNLFGFSWDIDTDYSKPRGMIFPVGSFGNTGFTGTTLWVDPGSDTT